MSSHNSKKLRIYTEEIFDKNECILPSGVDITLQK